MAESSSETESDWDPTLSSTSSDNNGESTSSSSEDFSTSSETTSSEDFSTSSETSSSEDFPSSSEETTSESFSSEDTTSEGGTSSEDSLSTESPTSTSSEALELIVDQEQVCCHQWITGSVTYTGDGSISISPSVTITGIIEFGYTWKYKPTDEDCGTNVFFVATAGDLEDQGMTSVVKVTLGPTPLPWLIPVGRYRTINYEIKPSGVYINAIIRRAGAGDIQFEDGSHAMTLSGSGDFSLFAVAISSDVGDVELVICSIVVLTVAYVQIDKVWENLLPALPFPMLENINFFTRNSSAGTGSGTGGPHSVPYDFLLMSQQQDETAGVWIRFQVKPNKPAVRSVLKFRYSTGMNELLGNSTLVDDANEARLSATGISGDASVVAGFQLDPESAFTVSDIFTRTQFIVRIVSKSDYLMAIEVLELLAFFGETFPIARAFLLAFLHDTTPHIPLDPIPPIILDRELKHNDAHHNVGAQFSPETNSGPIKEYAWGPGGIIADKMLQSFEIKEHVRIILDAHRAEVLAYFDAFPSEPHTFEFESDVDIQFAETWDLHLAFGSARMPVRLLVTVRLGDLDVTHVRLVATVQDFYNWRYPIDPDGARVQAGYGKLGSGRVFRVSVVLDGQVEIQYSY